MLWSESILINVISAGIWLMLGISTVKIYNLVKLRSKTPFSTFTNFDFRIKKIFLVYGLVETQSQGLRYSVEEGDVSALCASLSLLENRFGVKKVEVINCHASLPQFGSFENIFSISGPVWNPVTKGLIERLAIPIVEFANKNGEDVLLLKKGQKEICYKTISKDGVAREDFAIIIRGQLESTEGDFFQNIVVASGISSLGTFGAVMWLRRLANGGLNNEEYKKIRMAGNKILVILKVVDSSPKGFRAYTANCANPGFLSLSVAEIIFDSK